MVRLNQRVLVLTDNIKQDLSNLFMLDMEENIKRTIKFTLSKEVMICGVEKFKLVKIVLINQMVENFSSVGVSWIYICISLYIYVWGTISFI